MLYFLKFHKHANIALGGRLDSFGATGVSQWHGTFRQVHHILLILVALSRNGMDGARGSRWALSFNYMFMAGSLFRGYFSYKQGIFPYILRLHNTDSP